MSRAERAQYAFDNKDPLADISLKDLRAGLLDIVRAMLLRIPVYVASSMHINLIQFFSSFSTQDILTAPCLVHQQAKSLR